MSIWEKLFGKGLKEKPMTQGVAAGKKVYVFNEGNEGWGVIIKESHIPGILQEFREKLSASGVDDKSDEQLILMYACVAAELPRELSFAHAQEQQLRGGLVHHYDNCRDVVDPPLAPDWDGPGYAVFLYRKLKPTF